MKAKPMIAVAVAVATAMFAGALRADLTVYTEKVDGWTWTYTIAEGKAQDVTGTFSGKYSSPAPNLVIPAKLGGKAVASLGVNALNGKDFTTVTIPSTVTYIGYRAFGFCSNLKSVKLPDSVKTVAYHAFEGCTGLQCVDFGKNVSFIGVKAFEGCSSLRALVFRGAKEPNVDIDQYMDAPDSFGGVSKENCFVYVPAKAKDWPDGTWQGMPLVRGDCLVNVNVDVYEGGTHGTASGGGIYAVGKKITLKATPDKGCLCGGWLDQATGVCYGHSATLSYVVTGADTGFITGFAEPKDDYLDVNSPYAQYDADADGTVYVPVGVSSLSEPKVTVKGLPSGVKFDAAKMVLTGKASKPGVYNITVSATNKSIKEPRTVQFDLCVPTFKDELIELDDMYGWCLPGAAYVKTIAAADGCKVTGLPSGLKWTAKDIVDKNCGNVPANSIYGAAAKPGYYTLFFTKTDDSKVKHTATATFLVLPFKKLEIEMVGNSGKDKVTGAGEYAVGKKATLKATPDKDKVFGGWYYDKACTMLIDHSASIPFEMPEIGEVKFYAKFITSEEDVKGVSLIIDEAFPFDWDQTSWELSVPAGLRLEWPLAVTACLPKMPVTVSVSGLPPGLKFTAKDIVDSKTQKVIIPANTIYGAPSAASKKDKAGNVVPSNVKITVTTAGKNKLEFRIALAVTPLPEWAVGTFDGGGYDGQATLAVSSSGKISGKYLSGGQTWTLAAANFEDLDEYSCYETVLTATSGNLSREFTLRLSQAEEEERGGIIEAVEIGGDDVFDAFQNNWSREPWKTVGKEFNGVVFESPAADLDENDGEMTLRFSTSGKVTVKGSFVTGKDAKGNDIVYPVSGSTVLAGPSIEQDGAVRVRAFIYFPPKAGKFAGYMSVWDLEWNGQEFERIE